jgi:DNA-binding PadR family transcriptional regulator
MKQIEADSGKRLRLGPGALYGAIKHLLEEGLIEELPQRDSRRKYYQLTKEGWSRLGADIEYFEQTLSLAKGRKVPRPVSEVLYV